MNTNLETLFGLGGKVAAITGAGGELCGAMADALADLGVKIAVLDLSKEKAEQTARRISDRGGVALPIACDVLSADALESAREVIQRDLGEIDFLINGGIKNI